MFWKKHQKNILLALIIMIAVAMILNLSYYFYGSQELYPTQEQDDKVKLFSGLVFFVLLLIESALVNIYRKLTP
ncbi:hypothetical protein GCM10009133_31550 [Cocleimonas flava]|uniref:Uncharacterized protein n=1 Tax=Cocleimonas flava TaxID=634765 RepID=A0A4R1F8I3_9GAMM|nr:hypothetical protein EV695_0860 [Cocleimonas flava]